MAPYGNIMSSETKTASWFSIDGSAVYVDPAGYVKLTVESHQDEKGRISAQLYFKYLKKKMGLLEKIKMDGKLNRLEKAFDKAVDSGQDVLAKKFLDKIVIAVKEGQMWSRGIKFFIEQDDLDKYKHKIKGGHISDTDLKDFARIIPKEVLTKKKKVEDLFDKFIVYHYYNPETEEKISKKQQLTPEEKSKMRDPVLFGKIHETNKLYFIADWEDEHCDLTFDEIVDIMGKEENEITLTKEVKL